MGLTPPPSTTNFGLGRGIVSIALFAGGAPGEYVDVGECSVFDVELTKESLDKFSARTSLKKKVKTVIIQTGYTISFTLDEIHPNNLKMFGRATRSGKYLYFNMNNDAEYAIRFSSKDPVGPRARWEFWKTTIDPAAAISLIGDDWKTMQMTAEGLADESNHPESSQITVMFTTTTTTTTTTTSA